MPVLAITSRHDRLGREHPPRRIRRALRRATTVAAGLALLGGLGAPAATAEAPQIQTMSTPAPAAVVPLGGQTLVVDRLGQVTGEPNLGSLAGVPLSQPVTDAVPTPSGQGYWMVASDGGVFTFGDATFLGSLGHLRLNRPVTAMAATPRGTGYWLAASDGGVFAFGTAPFLGSLGNQALNQPIVSVAATASGRGYWLAAADGGVFTYGDAAFFGSAAGSGTTFEAIIPTAGGDGYWLVGQDGSVHGFGAAASGQAEVPEGHLIAGAAGSADGLRLGVAEAPPTGPVCPVAGPHSFVNSWGAPRSGGRSHRGVDMLAPNGTPVVAPVSGVVAHRSNSVGGRSFHLEGDDGNTYYGTHMAGYGASGRVAAGTVIGYVGDDGNAAGIDHLHFEVSVPGRGAINPYDYVAPICSGG